LVQQAAIMRGENCAVAGEHPRLGAMDVCPFIPVRDVTVAECVSCAKQLGHLLASELDVPVYLYGAASSRDYRKTVAQIRAGEYEALATRVSWHTILRDGLYHMTLT
jgi:glutamate formiminotransferase